MPAPTVRANSPLRVRAPGVRDVDLPLRGLSRFPRFSMIGDSGAASASHANSNGAATSTRGTTSVQLLLYSVEMEQGASELSARVVSPVRSALEMALRTGPG